jgi:selenide,water dikinase
VTATFKINTKRGGQECPPHTAWGDFLQFLYNVPMPALKTRLTETVKAGGCASKISPAVLDKVLAKLPRQHDPNVLVGFDHADDAGIYKINASTALVQTVDFFTPIVDDPYTFGQIAATNALSDVYAMGGRPITALAHVCFPANGDLEVLEQILAGGLSKMMEANCTVIGGHSIRDEETKFGYSVTGLIDPGRILTNGGAQPGDRLLFTKSLGTGVISTAIKSGTAKQSWIDAATRSMTTLNKAAAEVIAAFTTHRAATTGHVGTGLRPVQAEQSSALLAERPPTNDQRPIHSLTDVTGFGLIGHAREMALASKVSLRFHISKMPLLDGALDCIRAGNIPGGLKNNRDFAECVVGYEDGISEDLKTILFDPQTAGGLLIAVAPESTPDLIRDLKAADVPAVEIGEILPQTKPLIAITA